MSHWNYRIMKRQRGKETQYELVEAYYDDEGKLNGWTENPATFTGESAMDVIESLLRASEVASKWIPDETMQEVETIFGGPITDKARKRRANGD